MWFWALEPCSWGYNHPFISVHLTHLHPASSSIKSFGQNIFLGGYQGCAWWVLWVTSLLFSALSWPRQCWINLMLLHVSLGCLPPSDLSCSFCLTHTKCPCVSLLGAAAQPKSSLTEMSPTSSHHLFGKPSSFPPCLML